MESRPPLGGIVPPLATPLRPDETIDVEGLARLVDAQLRAGVHGLWVLGTTGRFDLIPDPAQRRVAEVVAREANGRVPLVLNVSDGGTARTLARAKLFDDLPFDFYAVLPPWYQPLTPVEVADYFRALADELSRPLVIYNAPWVCNQLPFDALRRLAEHPRIVGTKDVGPYLDRTQVWTREERRRLGFSYLHGFDLLAEATAMGTDGFVIAPANAFPELAVAIWDAARSNDDARAFRLQKQYLRLVHALGFGPTLACLEAACRHRGFFDRMLPRPLRPLDPETAARVAAVLDEVGVLPEG